MLHYQLTKYYHLLTSYKEICRNFIYYINYLVNSLKTIEIERSLLERIKFFMEENIQKISELNCPVVQ